jgi:hypothetical protein
MPHSSGAVGYMFSSAFKSGSWDGQSVVGVRPSRLGVGQLKRIGFSALHWRFYMLSY